VPTFLSGDSFVLTAAAIAPEGFVMRCTLAELLDEGSDEPSALDLDFSKLATPAPEAATVNESRGTPLSPFAVADEGSEDRRYRRARLVYGVGGASVTAFVVGGSLALGL